MYVHGTKIFSIRGPYYKEYPFYYLSVQRTACGRVSYDHKLIFRREVWFRHSWELYPRPSIAGQSRLDYIRTRAK